MKKALVLEGGGSRGAYQVGAIKAFEELGVKFDIVTGASIGAINASLYASNNLETLYKLWMDVSYDLVIKSDTKDWSTGATRKILKESFVKGGLDSTPLNGLIYQYVDEAKLRSSPIKYGLVVTNVSKRLKMEELSIDEIEKGKIHEYIIASAAVFPLFKKSKINEDTYVDGGYRDNSPSNLAIKMGADEITVVSLAISVPRRRLKNKDIKVTIIKPSKSLGFVMDFSKERALKNIRYGYLDVMKHYNKVAGNYFSFHKDDEYNEILKLFSNDEKKMITIIEALGRKLKLNDDILYNINDFIKIIKDSKYSHKLTRYL